MEVENGKIYMCGSRKVRILNDNIRFSCGNRRGAFDRIGVLLDEDGNDTPKIGVFDKTGTAHPLNDILVCWDLAEVKPPKDMTIKEIQEILGHEIKIVKEK